MPRTPSYDPGQNFGTVESAVPQSFSPLLPRQVIGSRKPDISDFTNSQHDHSSAATGGFTAPLFQDQDIITTTFSTASSTPQVTGLSSVVTVPAGSGRRVMVIVSANTFENNDNNGYAVVTLWRGEVGTGMQIKTVTNGRMTAGAAVGQMITIDNPGEGIFVYSVGLNSSVAGTSYITADPSYPAEIDTLLV